VRPKKKAPSSRCPFPIPCLARALLQPLPPARAPLTLLHVLSCSAKNPIWARQAEWEKNKKANLAKIAAEVNEKETHGTTFAPRINPRSRDLAVQAKRVS
jgi:hypothetical protein